VRRTVGVDAAPTRVHEFRYASGPSEIHLRLPVAQAMWQRAAGKRSAPDPCERTTVSRCAGDRSQFDSAMRHLDDVPELRCCNAARTCPLSLSNLWVARLLLRRSLLTFDRLRPLCSLPPTSTSPNCSGASIGIDARAVSRGRRCRSRWVWRSRRSVASKPQSTRKPMVFSRSWAGSAPSRKSSSRPRTSSANR
jgi:hypothetical protein